MQSNYLIPVGPISEIGLQVVARPRAGLDLSALVKKMEHLNPIVDVGETSILLVQETCPVSYNPVADFDPMELIWKCDYCNAFSRSRTTINDHERETHN